MNEIGNRQAKLNPNPCREVYLRIVEEGANCVKEGAESFNVVNPLVGSSTGGDAFLSLLQQPVYTLQQNGLGDHLRLQQLADKYHVP